MSALLSKREACLPLFQAVVAEELRVFRNFELVLQRVKELPNKLSLLLGQVLTRLESDHGFELVRDAACLLLCARRGLTDAELVALLGTTRQRWTALRTAVGKFIRQDTESGTVSLEVQSMKEAVSQRYALPQTDGDASPLSHTSAQRLSLRRYHLLLAYFSRALCTGLSDAEAAKHAHRQVGRPGRDAGVSGAPAVPWNGTWILATPTATHAACDVAYHLMQAFRLRSACTVLCDLAYIQVMCEHRLIFDVMDSLVQAYGMLREKSSQLNLDVDMPGGGHNQTTAAPGQRTDARPTVAIHDDASDGMDSSVDGAAASPGVKQSPSQARLAPSPSFSVTPRVLNKAQKPTVSVPQPPTSVTFDTPRTLGSTVQHQEQVPLGVALVRSEQRGKLRTLNAVRAKQLKALTAGGAMTTAAEGTLGSLGPGLQVIDAAVIAHAQREALVAALLRWLQADLHTLLAHPDLTLQRAMNQPDDSMVTEVAGVALAAREESEQATVYASPRKAAGGAVNGSGAGAGAGAGVTAKPVGSPVGVESGGTSTGDSSTRRKDGQVLLRWLNKPQRRNACIMKLCCSGGKVTGVSYTRDGMRIGSSHQDGVVRLWHTTTGDIERTLVVPDAVQRGVTCFQFRPCDSYVAIATQLVRAALTCTPHPTNRVVLCCVCQDIPYRRHHRRQDLPLGLRDGSMQGDSSPTTRQ